MANAFKSYPARQISTSGVQVYTCPSATQTIGVGLVISNTAKSPYTANVNINRNSTLYSIITDAVVPVGGSLVVSGVDQKMVLESGDIVFIKPSANNCCDVWLSILEIS